MRIKNPLALLKNPFSDSSSKMPKSRDFFDLFLEHNDWKPGFVKFPSIDVNETNDEIIIRAEVPNLDRKDIHIDVDRNCLTISGERDTLAEEKDGVCHIRELQYGKFSRTIELPFDIDEAKANASLSQGVLSIALKKPEGERRYTKSIPIS